MPGWIDSEVEGSVRGAGPTTILTPVDQFDRWFADDFVKSFGDQVSFNLVRSARAGIFVQVSNGRRHLVWDKEFFRRILLFLSVIEIDDASDRHMAFGESAYDLSALLAFQEGLLITSHYLAMRRGTLSSTLDKAKWDEIQRRPAFLMGSSQAWRLTNISRMFCYYHESAHCEAAFRPEDFTIIRETISEWPEFSRQIVREAANVPSQADDFMLELARFYLGQRRMDVTASLDALDRVFTPPNLEEVSCDLYAITNTVDSCRVTTVDEFAEVFCGVTITWVIYDFIETLRILFRALVRGDDDVHIEYHHGSERNFLRALMLLSELRRKIPASVDQDTCEKAILSRLDSVQSRFIERAMEHLSELLQRFMFAGEFWKEHRIMQTKLSPEEEKQVFDSLREYFQLTDDPRTSEGATNATYVRALSLESSLAHARGEKLNLSEGFTAGPSIRSPAALSHILRIVEKHKSVLFANQHA